MAHFQLGLHAIVGELGCVAFLWIFIELFGPNNESSLSRAQKASAAGLIFIMLSWVAGAYYYLVHYGAHVKPAILSGPMPYSHLVGMELKEHSFLVLPLLSLYVFLLLRQEPGQFLDRGVSRKPAMALSLFIALYGFSMAGMGYLVSVGFRVALEHGAMQ